MMGFTWIVVIVLLVWGTRSLDLPRRDESSRSRAILEERFARGEIDEDEFERRIRTLRTG